MKREAIGGIGSAVAVILAWAAGIAGLDMPAEVVAALTVLIGYGARALGHIDRFRGNGKTRA